jgi:hypothetical protein
VQNTPLALVDPTGFIRDRIEATPAPAMSSGPNGIPLPTPGLGDTVIKDTISASPSGDGILATCNPCGPTIGFSGGGVDDASFNPAGVTPLASQGGLTPGMMGLAVGLAVGGGLTSQGGYTVPATGAPISADRVFAEQVPLGMRASDFYRPFQFAPRQMTDADRIVAGVGLGIMTAGAAWALAPALLPSLATRGAASSAVNGLRLGKQLASEAGSAELMAGGGRIMAGAGTSKPIRDLGRLVTEYGGKPGDWVKITSEGRKFPDLTTIEVHGYRNLTTGQTLELKSKIGAWSP